MSVKRWLIGGLAIGLQTSISMGQQQAPSAEDIKALRQRIEKLEQKVKTLEETRRPAPDTNAAATQQRGCENSGRKQRRARAARVLAEAAGARARLGFFRVRAGRVPRV